MLININKLISLQDKILIYYYFKATTIKYPLSFFFFLKLDLTHFNQ